MLAGLFLIVPVMGVLVVWLESPKIEHKAYEELGAIAELKVKQVNAWIAERRFDGRSLVNDPGFRRLVSGNIDKSLSDSTTVLSKRLEAFRAAYNYDSISIINSNGEPLLQVGAAGSAGQTFPLPPNLKPGSSQSKTVPSSDADTTMAAPLSDHQLHYYFAHDRMHIAFSYPLYTTTKREKPFATLIFHIEPNRFLYPYISGWPTASSSGESLLAAQSGKNVVFLTPLRHLFMTPGAMTHRLDDPSLPAAVALRQGNNGIFEGLDYRGVRVLAAYRAVTDTGWQLIAKLDREEVMEPLYHLVTWVCLVTLAAAVLVSFLFSRLWRQQQHLHDLTVQAERRKADELLSQFYDMPFIGIAFTSPQNKHWLRFNNRLCEIFGYSRKELNEMSWPELTHPDDLEADIAEFERVMRNESDGYSMDKRFIRKDGSLLYAYIDVKCVRRMDATVDYFVVMLQDISDRKQAEIALEHARQRAQHYLDVAGVMMLALDATGNIRMANRKACEILGYSEDETLGKNWFDHFLPDSEHDNIKTVFARLMAGEIEPVEHAENHVITRTGEQRLIAWHNSALRDKNGVITGVLSSGADISEERAAQEALSDSQARLRTLVQTIPDLVWLKDNQGVYLNCNPMFERLFGASEAEIVGKTDYDFVDRELADFFREHDRKAIAAGKPSINEETLTFASDGYQGVFETIKTPMHDEHGQLIGVLSIAHDISERKQSAEHIEKLSRLYATLSQTNQAIVRCKNEQEMFEQVCRNAVEYGHFKMAWIGLIDTESPAIIPAVSFGKATAYLEKVNLSLDPDSAYSQGPTGQAMRQGHPYWCQDFLHENATTPWHEQARQAGFLASASLPLKRDNEIIGSFNLYAGEVNAFDTESQNLLTEMALDISFALDNFEREKQRYEAQQRLALIIKGSNDAPWDWDLVSDRIYYSPQWWDLFGYQVDELPGDSELWRRIAHPDDLEQVDRVLQGLFEDPERERDSVECRMRHKDQHYVPVLVRGIISRDTAGKPIRLTGTVMDLTAQKKTENQLRNQLDELNRWFTTTIDREERILELKQEVNILLQQQQQPPRYQSAADSDSSGNREI